MITIEAITIVKFYLVEEMSLGLGKPGVHCVIGRNLDGGSDSNGSGKSTIFEALTWCFFGITSRGKFEPEDGCEVIIWFKDRDQGCIVQRARKNGTVSLTITLEGETPLNVSGKNVATGNELVIGLLGCDYHTFTRSIYFPQEGVIPFGYLTDKILKEFFLEKFLEIGWVSECHERVKTVLKNAQNRLVVLERNIEYNENAIREYSISLERESTESNLWEIERQDKLVDIQQSIDEHSLHIPDVQPTEGWEEERRRIREKSDKYSVLVQKWEKKIREIENEQHTRNVSINRIDIKLVATKKDIINYQDRIGTKCRSCGNLITEQNVSHVLEETKMKEEELLEGKKNLEEVFEIFGDKLLVYDGVKKHCEDIANILYDKESELVKANDNPEVKRLRKIIEDMRKRYDDLKKSKNPYEARKKEAKELKWKKEKEKVSLVMEQKTIQEEITVFQFWMIGFGVQGIQSFLLESMTPTLNSKIKKYLDMISGGMLQAEFHTVKKLKNGEYRENFGLSASSTVGAQTYRGLSGGEKARVNIAVSLALGEMKRIQSEKEINLLILDEPFNGLDSEGVSDVLSLLKENFNQMPLFLVSHVDVDQSMVDDLIVMKKQNGISSLEV
jgi:DNA repair exonuclease SbcCD ATPase subunit